MGHQIEHRCFPVGNDTKEERAAIEKKLNDYVAKVTWEEGGHGLGGHIQWHPEKVYYGEVEAEQAIEKLDRRGDYNQIAVKSWIPTENHLLWQNAYDRLMTVYADVLKFRKSQHEIGAREALKQAEYYLHVAQEEFKEANKNSKLMWVVKIEYHT